jgi:hypothetical protein
MRRLFDMLSAMIPFIYIYYACQKCGAELCSTDFFIGQCRLKLPLLQLTQKGYLTKCHS